MQAPFWSQGLNRYSYVFNNPVNNTDPSGFEANGEDSTLGIMGWGAATVGGAYLSTVGFGAIAGGTGIVGLNIGTSLLTNQYSLFDGSSASTHVGAAPSAAPKGTGANRGAGGGATGENTGGISSPRKNTGSATTGAPSTAIGQKRVDAAYRRSGFDWGKPPQYNSQLPDYGWTGKDGVQIGPPALRSEPVLRSTITHEGVHVRQLKQGNYPHWRSEVGAAVSEAEAYREELLQENVEQSGLSQEEQDFVAGEYKKQLLSLAQLGTQGDYYLRQILINQDFTLLPRDARVGAVPAWIK